jgi:hypothetical protein
MGGNRGASLFTYIAFFGLLFFACLLAASWIFTGISLGVIGLFWLASRIWPAFRLWLLTNINLMVTMLVGGLWHGASWNFVIWGGLNGLGIVFYKLWRKISPWESRNTWYKHAWAIFITFTFISFTRIWFRSGSKNTWEEMNEVHDIWQELFAANVMLKKILFELDFTIAPQVIAAFWNVFAVMLLGFIIHWLPSSWKTYYRERFASSSIYTMAMVVLVSIFILYQVLSAGMQPFIYFQF